MKSARTNGTSLVEIMIAMLVFVIMVIGTSSYVVHGRSSVLLQGRRRVALEVVNSRLEALAAERFESLVSRTRTDYYIAWDGSRWNESDSDPGETVSVNGVAGSPITTRLQRVPGAGGQMEFLRVRVSVAYRAGSADRVALETLLGP